jgi:septum site-determining protein MinC
LQLRGAPGGLLVLTLPGAMRFDALRIALRDLFAESPGRFRGARVRLDLGARDLDLMEIRRIVHLAKDEFDVEIVGLQCESLALQRMTERELKLKLSVGASAPPDPAEAAVEQTTAAVLVEENETSPALFAVDPDRVGPNFETEEGSTDIVSPPGESDDEDEGLGGRTLTIQHTLRSGACVRFGGDVQVFGDVNPGAQVIAGGSIVVLGALKGMAHAGTRDEKAVILAFDLRPTQLRIGKVIGVVPGADPDRAGKTFNPEMATIVDGHIAVEPYRGKLPHQKENA